MPFHALDEFSQPICYATVRYRNNFKGKCIKSNEKILDAMCFLDENGKEISGKNSHWVQWINVQDELPKKAGVYWVAYELNGRLKSHYCLWEEKFRKYQGNTWGWRSREAVRRTNIKFWMEIPNPPCQADEK